MDPWYRVVTPREEVREGRSFSPDEFAIALEQVVAGTAPIDYRDPEQFFSRTYFTRALSEHSGMVLRRLSGQTGNTAPVLTLMTQFGGGKTHTLTSLYHLVNLGPDARNLPGVDDLLRDTGISAAPSARVGVFVGNAWDPSPGHETPWIDLARQLAGDEGVAELGSSAAATPPGTDAITRVFAKADRPVLILLDEVLNFVNRHRGMADSMHAFIQNLTVAVTGATHAAAVISLPRSQVEMTDSDREWQERITKVVRRVAQDLIANDEAEISEVVRRRLFDDIGSERVRKRVAKTYADWCFERSARLPSEWTAVDTATTDAKARDFLRSRFEACYPFHPATLSVFQRKWRALSQFQQTRGSLAMLAQWISWAARDQFNEARNEPLITLGSAPLDVPEFRAIALGQLGEQRLDAAIEADIAGEASHAEALDVDARGALRHIHRRVGTAVLFESSGGQVDRVAHLPELRFALGEPDVETTTIDNAVTALEQSSFFIRKIGADGYRIHHQATLRKVVSDRRASLDEDEVKSAVRKLVQDEFAKGPTTPIVYFPQDGDAVADSPRLTLVVLDPDREWHGRDAFAQQVGPWMRERGTSPRLYPGALVWCSKKQGRELRDSVENWLAWRRVSQEVAQGLLGTEYDQADRAEVNARVREAEEIAKEEVWAGYRHVALTEDADGIKTIDLGAGHSSGSETLSGRVIGALRSEALLNESVGAGYIDRHWPHAFRDTGAWPLTSLRQSFLNGALTRLIDPDTVLRQRIIEFVAQGEFGLASGDNGDGTFGEVMFLKAVGAEDVVFEPGMFLLTKARAEQTSAVAEPTPIGPESSPTVGADPEPQKIGGRAQVGLPIETGQKVTLRLTGDLPTHTWSKFGIAILPKLPSDGEPRAGVEFTVNVDAGVARNLQLELQQALADLGLSATVVIETDENE